MKQILKSKGAVLIMTMMAVSLLFMMVSALMQTTGIGLHNSTNFYDREAALQAAQSGLDYATTRLQKNYGWRGDSNCKYWDNNETDIKTYGSSSQGVVVSENNGNVVGLLTSSAGVKTAFRIKFSFEDNSNDTYNKAVRSRFGLPDTDEMLPEILPIKLPYVSINNITNTESILVHRANTSGKKVASTVPNLEFGADNNKLSEEYACHLPPQRAYIVVEGLSGKGLRDCETPTDVNKVANEGTKVVAHRYIEAYLSSTVPIVDGDAACAKGKIEFKVADKLLVSTNTEIATSEVQSANIKNTVPAPGRIRSCEGDIEIKGTINTFNGYLSCPGNATFNNKATYYVSKSDGKQERTEFTNNREKTKKTQMEEVKWEDVAQADNTSANRLEGGYYQWHTAANSTAEKPTYELRYYADGYNKDVKGRPVPKNPNNYMIAVAGNINDDTTTVEVEPPNPTDEAGIEPGNPTSGGTTPSVPKFSMGPADKIKFIRDEKGNITEPTLSLFGNLHCDGDFTIGSNVNTVTNHIPRLLMSSYYENIGSGEAADKLEEGVLTATGDIFIASALYGTGAVVTETGNVTFMGGSVLESGSCGVAVYGNDVTLKSMEMAVCESYRGKTLDYDYANTSENVNFNPDGTMDLSLDTKFYNLVKEFYTAKGNKADKYIKLESYFADNGVDIKEVGTVKQYRNNKDILEINIKVDDNCYYVVHTAPWDNWIHVSDCNWKYDDDADFDKMKIPKNAIIIPENEIFNAKQKKVVEHFGSICYGDQTFSGVVYAKGNFTADLAGKYNLMMRGAVRAEQGKIFANCRASRLDYDENYMSQLVPSYNGLRCKLWNCW